MTKLTAATRKSVPAAKTGLPGKRTAKGGAVSGSYPMPDRAHAANAKARVAQHGTPTEKAEVNAKANKILSKSDNGSSKSSKPAAKKKTSAKKPAAKRAPGTRSPMAVKSPGPVDNPDMMGGGY